MRCIDSVPREELRGTKVIVRAGFDLTLDEHGEANDLFRIKKGIATLRFLHEAGAKTVILSHIGREQSNTNAPVERALRHHIHVTYVPDLLGHLAKSAVEAMRDGEIVLLENLRQHYDLEQANDEQFARDLAAYGDIYVNDAFSNSHREHSSMVGIPKLLPSYAGMQLCAEVAALQGALNPPQPAFAIIGGAKFETKIPVINLFLQKYDHTFVTGALSNDIFKAEGLQVGRSRVSEELPSQAVIGHPRLIAPIDVTAERSDGQAFVKKPKEVTADDKIVDIGPDTLALITPHIERANFIIWNGPTGLYEDGYGAYTHALGEILARRVAAGAECIIGGGDTIAALEENGLTEEQLGFLSTGGGAMLEYLVKGTLPAIEALE